MPAVTSVNMAAMIKGLVKEAILQLCQENLAYRGRLEVDGIICITGEEEGQQIVIKVHEELFPDEAQQEDYSPEKSMVFQMLSQEQDNDQDSSRGGDENKHGKIPIPISTQGFREHRDTSINSEPYNMYQEEAENLSPRKRLKLDFGQKNGEDRPRLSSQLSHKYPNKLLHMSGGRAYPSMLTALKKPIVIKPTPVHSRLDRVPPAASGAIPECKTCNIAFDSFEILQEHNDLVHNACTCHHCYRTFTSRSNLERHLRLHTGQKPYVCGTCGKAFSRKDHLGNHVAKHAFKCGTCLKRFSDKEGLSIHYEQDHDAKLFDICFQCNKGFSDASMFHEHKKIHPGASIEQNHNHREASNSPRVSPAKNMQEEVAKVIPCEQCDFTTNDRMVLRKHNLIHGDASKCHFTCISCLQRFGDPLQYEQHLEQEHPNEQYIYECAFCRRINKTFSELKRHETYHIHVDIEKYTCPHCGIHFTSMKCMKDHMSNHQSPMKNHGIPMVPKFKCSSCGNCFAKLSELRTHQQELLHTGWKVAKPNQENSFGSPQASTPVKLNFDGDVDEDADSKLSPIMSTHTDEFDGDGEEIVVIQPEAPEETMDRSEEDYSRDFVITDNPAPVIEVMDDDVGMNQSEADGSLSNADSEIGALQMNDVSGAGSDIDGDGESSNGTISDLNSNTKGKGKGDEGTPRVNSRYSTPVIDGPFTCSHCKVEIANFFDFEAHFNQIHLRFPCMYCPKTFGQKANRDRHVCIHTGEKPFPCPDCDQAFSRGDKLKTHRVKSHGQGQGSNFALETLKSA